MKKKNHKSSAAARWAAGLFVGLLAVSAMADTRSDKSDITRNLDVFTSLYKELQTFYVDSIDADKSINTAIAAMLNDIDPYTEYYPPSDHDDLAMMTSAEYGGIGSVITEPKRGKGVIISEPYEGSPSALAGLLPGDTIVTIDNDTVLTWHTDSVSARLKGQPGTVLRLSVKRPYDGDSTRHFTITRQKIQLPAVPYYGVVRDSLGYIYLTQFTDIAAKQVREALTELKKDPRVKAYVLDLRGNHGGLLEEAVQIVGMFVPKNTEVIRTRGKGRLNEKIYKTTDKPIDSSTPLYVLTDGQSASAAEITAGAIQDLDRGVIVGTRSYGKGLVQTTRQLPYEGILKVTTAKYYIPSGRLIQAIDYSRRNPDGSVARIPDSLTSVFKTANGREVRDGGGITPDVKVTYGEVNRLTYNIVSDNWAFDFATKFHAENPSIAPAEQFTITDTVFADFKNFVNPEKFQYDKVCEQMIENLRKAATTEGYMNDSVKAHIDKLETLLHHNLNHDLDQNRKDISDLLATEILKRYYYQKGQVIQTLKNDAAIDTVMSIESTPGRYNKILSNTKEK
ncbi:MAG: S41 family peptidase [Muribaculum sp.]|nr:S41 family peptidase [Muribaculaceae bacterium]MCM1081707.1 S41 family peptidase [Muribaculum sp.]